MNKNKKYKIKGNKESIGCSLNYGPFAKCFGCESSMNNIIHDYNRINSYFENGYDILPQNNNNNYYYNYNNQKIVYDLKEVEIFEITFDN